jgi:hypothetical protein
MTEGNKDKRNIGDGIDINQDTLLSLATAVDPHTHTFIIPQKLPPQPLWVEVQICFLASCATRRELTTDGNSEGLALKKKTHANTHRFEH